MKQNMFETFLGAIVVLAAGLFLAYSLDQAEVKAASGQYEVFADFSGIGGLRSGDDVQISGVKVGSVGDVTLDPVTFLARVELLIDDSVELPVDTAAMISSESLLGGLYLALEPGAEDDVLKPGDRVAYTQAPQNLEQLLGQFIFSLQDEKKESP